MNDLLKDRIRAHRSAPDVYDPPSFEDMARRIEELEDALEYGVELIKGDAVGSEWKRKCNEFLRISRAVLKTMKGTTKCSHSQS